MQMHTRLLNGLALHLQRERQVQGLSREQLAAVCNVSPSFIRDAETNPGRCSVQLLLQLIQGLGLKVEISGWASEINSSAQSPSGTEGPTA
jgi:HTH-type transcriptional regulator / antitoxin HipB